MPLLVAANAWTVLRAPEKYIVVSKNANVSEERTLFSEHIGANPIFLARLIPLLGQFLNEQGNNFVLDLFLRDGKKIERELERGEGDRVERCFDAVLWSYRLTPMM